MGQVTGVEFGGIVSGGDTKGGQFIWLTLRLSDGDKTIFVEKSKVSALLMGICTAASLAHQSRVTANPDENKAGSLDTAYALPLLDAKSGTSADGVHSIIDLRIDTKMDRPGNLFIAADRVGLLRLRAAVARALLKLSGAKAKAN